MLTAPSLGRPAMPSGLIDFQPSPSDLRHACTRDEIRAILRHDLLTGAARWIGAEGLRLDDPHAHTRLLRAVAPFREGLAGLNGHPHTAVVDWSTVRGIGVDALAALPVFGATLLGSGATVVFCEPRDKAVAELLDASGLLPHLGGRWVWEADPSDSTAALMRPRTWPTEFPCYSNAKALERPGRFIEGTRGRRHLAARRLGRLPFVPNAELVSRSVHLLAPAVVIGNPQSPPLQELGALYQLVGDAVELRVRDRTLAVELAGLVTSALREAATNACKHARATRIGIVAGITLGTRPSLEVAVSDNGIGIAETRRPYSEVLHCIPERHFVLDVFRESHEPKDGKRGPGRGFVLVVRRLLASVDARLRVRSGGFLVDLTRRGAVPRVVAEESAGLGTTLQLSVPLDRSWI